MMTITITRQQLEDLSACDEALRAFAEVYGTIATEDWTRDKQIEILLSPLGRFVGWAWEKGLLPMWSMNGASLYGANLNYASLNGANLNGASLNGANLNHANLNGAKVCLCNSTPCHQLRAVLAKWGWAPSADGLLESAERINP